MAVWDTFLGPAAVVMWFLPWHVPAMRTLRLRWSDRLGRAITWFTSGNIMFVPLEAAIHNWQGAATGGLIGGSAGYALWRAWREHRPPRRRLRDKAAAAVGRLVERMQPARAPIPVRALGGA